MKGRDIECCDDCPLHREVCDGGLRSGANGELIEPPCFYWEDDEEINFVLYYTYD
jgi:hypothetical protein